MKNIRLDRFLVEMGIGSRSQIKDFVKKKKIKINEQIVTKCDIKIDPDIDKIKVENVTIIYTEFEYIMLHKPAGCVTATKDSKDKTVMDYIGDHIRDDLSPVGRLDKDTEGLLLLTNDGELSHYLLSPKRHVDKTYYAEIKGIVTEEDVKAFKDGLDIKDDKPTLPADLKILSTDHESFKSKIEVTIKEGRFHQVKRMFEAVGKEVTYLKRLSMGPLMLDSNLPVGTARHLTDDEIQSLLALKPSTK